MAAERADLGNAEAMAAPLASLEAFRECCTVPGSCIAGRHLSRRYSVLGIRENAESRLSMIVRPDELVEEFVARIANGLLEGHGRSATLKPNHDQPGREVLCWRWISLALPVDLMLAAGDLGFAARVRVLDKSIQVLEPTAHLHLHATASVPFWVIWSEFGRTARFRDVKDCPEQFPEVEEWRMWLCRAFVARRALGVWTTQGAKAVRDLIGEWPEIDFALSDLRRGRVIDRSRRMESSLTRFLRVPDSFIGLGGRDRQSGSERRRFNPWQGIEFDRRCVNFMRQRVSGKDAVKEHSSFRDLWVQMTRIRVMLYRHLVHDPAQSGLDAFAKKFSRLDQYLATDNSDWSYSREVQAAVELERDLDVKTVELRKAPGGLSKLNWMHRYSQQPYESGNRIVGEFNCLGVHDLAARPSVTWTLHFLRDQHRKDGLQKQIFGHHATARRLSTIIRLRPELLKSIRGLDVASRELSGPLWVVSAPLAMVREESVRACLCNPGICPLRVTVHVGEDFRHLLSGLRAIHEPFWWRMMRRGDRIGHALALGWDPHDWCDKNPSVLQPRLERMFDIAWLLDFVSLRQISGISGASLEFARNELRGLLKGWEGCNGEVDVDEFVSVVREIGRPWLWNEINGPYWMQSQLEGKYWRLLKMILLRYDRQEDLVEVATKGQGGLLELIRDELARLLAKWRTPIEINPSSNLLIGNLPYPLAQPLFHLDPFEREEDRGLVLTISADDPSCFATSLADEFAYAWAGMVLGKGESPTYAQEWLERAARSARRAAF